MAQFPQETRDYYQEHIRKARALFSKDFTPTKISSTAAGFCDAYHSRYSFLTNLETGKYSCYAHEMEKNHIFGYNCTTVIPSLYLLYEALELKPQIWQFFEFRDIKKNNKKEDEQKPFESHHFALTIQLHNKTYLVDSFYENFGVITNQQQDKWKVLGRHGFKSLTREFSQVINYSESDFADMMLRLRDPAESLDMLVAGQRVYEDRQIAKTKSVLMAYYNDTPRKLTTRLFIEQTGIQNKVIYYHQSLNQQAQVTDITLDFYVAKKTTWTSLVEPKKIATLTLTQLSSIRRLLSSITNYTKQERIHHSINSPQNASKKKSLTDLVEQVFQNLTPTEQDTIRPSIYARTLYDATQPLKEYLYSTKKREQHLQELIKKECQMRDQIRPLEDEKYLLGWKLVKKNPKRKKYLKTEIAKKYKEKEKLVEDIDLYNNARKRNKYVFHSSMDKILFSQHQLKDKSLEDMAQMIQTQNLDWHIGYLGMIADYIPFIVDGKKDLELKVFLPSIQQKVKARIERDERKE